MMLIAPTTDSMTEDESAILTADGASDTSQSDDEEMTLVFLGPDQCCAISDKGMQDKYICICGYQATKCVRKSHNVLRGSPFTRASVNHYIAYGRLKSVQDGVALANTVRNSFPPEANILQSPAASTKPLPPSATTWSPDTKPKAKKGSRGTPTSATRTVKWGAVESTMAPTTDPTLIEQCYSFSKVAVDEGTLELKADNKSLKDSVNRMEEFLQAFVQDSMANRNKPSPTDTIPPPSVPPSDEASDSADSSDDESTDEDDTVPSKPKRVKSFYVVSRGHSPGVYSNWKATRAQLIGFKDHKYKGFDTRKTAQRWYKTTMYGRKSKPDTTTDSDDEQGFGYDPNDDALTLKDDPSTLQQIHGVSIDVEQEVLDLLCPKLLKKEGRKELIDACPDIVSLPGKTASIQSESKHIDVQSMSDLLATQRDATSKSGIQTDSQWKNASRNQLSFITSKEILQTKSYRTTTLSLPYSQEFQREMCSGTHKLPHGTVGHCCLDCYRIFSSFCQPFL
jgi:hypothetical protein